MNPKARNMADCNGGVARLPGSDERSPLTATPRRVSPLKFKSKLYGHMVMSFSSPSPLTVLSCKNPSGRWSRDIQESLKALDRGLHEVSSAKLATNDSDRTCPLRPRP